MEGSNIPLTDWFIAAYLMTSNKNGINTTQLRVYLDVSKKTAWFMLQRIRQAFVQNPNEKFDGVVEVDTIRLRLKSLKKLLQRLEF